MVPKVICKARKILKKEKGGRTQQSETVLVCSTEDEVLRQLSGYRLTEKQNGLTAPEVILRLFDPARPTKEWQLITRAGATDTVSLHTVH